MSDPTEHTTLGTVGDSEILRTERLELRHFSVTFARAVVSGDVSGFDVAVDYPHSDTVDIAYGVLEESEASGSSTWIIVRTSDGVIVGDCGWFAVAGAHDAVEIGYGMAESARGCGFATEAVGALAEHISELGVARIVATTEADNVASARVLDKLGFGLHAIDGGHCTYQRVSAATT